LQSPEFGQILKTGKFLRGRGLAVSFRPNHYQWARVGLVVPKRLLPRAVDRNRCKRLLRNWFRLHQAEISGSDWIIRLLKVPARLDASMLLELDRFLLRRE